MSYRRAWLLVDAMNRCWTAPLVEATAGGGQGKGARLTACGQDVLAAYRALERQVAEAAVCDALHALTERLLAAPRNIRRPRKLSLSGFTGLPSWSFSTEKRIVLPVITAGHTFPPVHCLADGNNGSQLWSRANLYFHSKGFAAFLVVACAAVDPAKF